MLLCLECSSWHYGKDCRYTANCHREHTQFYNKTNGLCTCYLNWTSTNCDQDFNQCSLAHSPCNTTSSTCYNKWGSFECRCLQGFESRSENTCRGLYWFIAIRVTQHLLFKIRSSSTRQNKYWTGLSILMYSKIWDTLGDKWLTNFPLVVYVLFQT